MDELYEIHYKDGMTEIHIKGSTPEFVQEWWEKLQQKEAQKWGIGSEEADSKRKSKV